MWTYVGIAVGGTLGCWARYLMTLLVQAVFGRNFPYATLSILTANLPLVIEFYDSPEVVEAALEVLNGLVPRGHLVCWRATCL
jgi:fluoride ion exporter CrcB/FEX